MKIAKIKFAVNDDFQTGECYNCLLGADLGEGDYGCALGYRNCDCPIELDDYSYAMDEEDITD